MNRRILNSRFGFGYNIIQNQIDEQTCPHTGNSQCTDPVFTLNRRICDNSYGFCGIDGGIIHICLCMSCIIIFNCHRRAGYITRTGNTGINIKGGNIVLRSHIDGGVINLCVLNRCINRAVIGIHNRRHRQSHRTGSGTGNQNMAGIHIFIGTDINGSRADFVFSVLVINLRNGFVLYLIDNRIGIGSHRTGTAAGYHNLLIIFFVGGKQIEGIIYSQLRVIAD